MQTVVRSPFTAVKTEGGLLPMDVLQRIADGQGLPGLQPEDYHLSGERLNEAISRSWPRCQKAWRVFVEQREKQAESATTLTRERWLLVLFDVLGYGRLPAVRSVEVDGASYPISHLWERAPFLLAGYDQELDRRAEGRTRRSPHSLMQELLNRSPDYRWGFISNGLRLRLLRDNASLSRSAYVEFDLEAIMEGELYAEFSLLWLVCHQSRVEDIGRAAAAYAVAEGAVEGDGGDDADEGNGDKTAGAASVATGYDCWLERWSQLAAEQGTRALDALRQGVERAIEALGSGFLTHPANSALCARLRTGELGTQAYYQQVRRLVYRLLFLFVAEDRDLLLLPGSDAVTRARYHDFYSLARIRRLAEVSRGGRHPDLYRQLRRLFALLRSGYPPLGLPSLGSYLFSGRATPDLDGAELANQELLAAIFALGFTVENGVRRPVDYRNLDTEELGSVYESLLELHPQLTVETGEFRLRIAAGSERKTTGSYYTPTALVNELLNSALEPVVADRLAQAEAEWRKGAERSPERRRQLAERALLRIKVLDYATGSGHMLIGAARRLARHLARIRTGDEEPGPGAVRAALRDVVRYCLYGVDLNETSVELCKVALWMESLEPGKPLGFLDAHIRPGNSLIGVLALETLADGIPDDAYAAKTGDDRTAAGALKKRNKRERDSLTATLFEVGEEDDLLAEWRAFLAEPEETPEQVAAKEAHYARLRADPRWAKLQTACHLWTAPFFAEYTGDKQRDQRIPTTADLRAYLANPAKADPAAVAYAETLAQRRHFFHWPLEFPEIFDRGGFAVILSNPPWERIKLQEKEWFAARDPEIAAAPNAAARRRKIEALEKENPSLLVEFRAAQHSAEAESHFVRNSGRYPLCGRGDVNTYTVFAELAKDAIHPQGRAGIIVPTGIATDDTTKYYFQEIMESRALASLYDFENRRRLFPAVDSRIKFCLLTLTGEERPADAAEFVFFALDVADLLDEQRRFTLSAEEIALLNPNTRTCPIFRSKRDAELTKGIYRRVPVLIKEGPPEENPWGIKFATMFHMSNDSHLFRTRAQLEAEGWRLEGNRFVKMGSREWGVGNGGEGVAGKEVYLPLYEAKMFHHFDHRFADSGIPRGGAFIRGASGYLSEVEHLDPFRTSRSRYWVLEAEIQSRCSVVQYTRQWFVAFRDVTGNVANARTAIFSILPLVGIGNTAPLILCSHTNGEIAALVALLSSFVFDFQARMSIGGTHLNFYILRQLPVLTSETFHEDCAWGRSELLLASDGQQTSFRPDSSGAWLLQRALELVYTAWDLAPFARDCGYDGPPFRWDEERRFLLRCELDAAYFHLYGIERDDVDYILETFPIVKRKDVAAHGEYRTKRVILDIYDEMAEAMRSGVPYRTRLDPPPADPRVAHPPR